MLMQSSQLTHVGWTYIVQLQNDLHCLQVAAIGFCMGGSLAVAASQYGKIHAAVACYGIPQFEICPVSSSPYNARRYMPRFAGTTAQLICPASECAMWQLTHHYCSLRLEIVYFCC